ncbi:MAG: hypothetical protein V1736_10280, partial [Pseudomonadota bacterium]
IDFQIKFLGALSVGDVRTGTIPSLLPSQKHYLKVYKSALSISEAGMAPSLISRGGETITSTIVEPLVPAVGPPSNIISTPLPSCS